MNDHPNDEFDELMRRALSEEAAKIEPADGLHEIQSRVRGQRRSVNRRPWVMTAGAAVLGTAAAVGAFAVLNDTTKQADEPSVAGAPGTTATASDLPLTPSTAPPTPKPSPTQAPSDQPSTTAKVRATPEPEVKGKAVPLYWVGKTSGRTTGPGMRLYRTYTKVSGAPIRDAVQQLSLNRPDDPDYYTLWGGSTVSSVRLADGVVLIDFKALPKERLDPDVAGMAVQQLVYTVQGVLGDTSQRIQVTEQGRTSPALFGQVDTSKPFSRAQAANVQALVWITSPANGAVTSSPVKVGGTAAAFEAQVDWKATNLKTKQVIKNYTMAAEGQKFSEFAFSAKLDPGEWQIEAYLTSPEDGRITDTDSKIIYVK